jgi:hypothetical protein
MSRTSAESSQAIFVAAAGRDGYITQLPTWKLWPRR